MFAVIAITRGRTVFIAFNCQARRIVCLPYSTPPLHRYCRVRDTKYFICVRLDIRVFNIYHFDTSTLAHALPCTTVQIWLGSHRGRGI